MDAIRGDGFFVPYDSVISVSVSSETLTILTTAGLVTVRCRHPRFIVRDYVAGHPLDLRKSRNLGEHALNYGQIEAVFSKRHPRPDSAPPQPDCVPVRIGWFVVELSTRTDYHPWCSLQLVAITRAQEMVLEFGDVTYRCTLPQSGNLQAAFDEITGGRRCGHCSVHSLTAFLDWLPSPRTHFERIEEIAERPASSDGFLSVADFGELAEHAAFKAKTMTGKNTRVVGLDMDR